MKLLSFLQITLRALPFYMHCIISKTEWLFPTCTSSSESSDPSAFSSFVRFIAFVVDFFWDSLLEVVSPLDSVLDWMPPF